MNKTSFMSELKDIYSTSLHHNQWAKDYFLLDMPKNESLHGDINAERCWGIYNVSKRNQLGMLLLGEESMRKQKSLVQNFGLNSFYGHGVSEPWLGGWLNSNSCADNSIRKSGSILSDRMWNPLMNDAWLLGGIHHYQDFHLVCEGIGHQRLVDKMNELPLQTAVGARQLFRFGCNAPSFSASDHNAKIISNWKKWFADNPTVFYAPWGPRVFVREAIGLMIFGYKPKFTAHEVLFYCNDKMSARKASFKAYFNALSDVGYHDGISKKMKVLNTLHNWLFL
ncbi:hypothetical protein F3J28_03440 [Enterobacter sp. Ap-1006]|uniref:hypothetical protein n=1 Tax=Enterobacter sp. Ap-1006 TaxID=2608345 RepID=UPI00141F6B97|nr:hypothetical protein [Enterobacter sp. Ap-1006]NIF46822.1 hypothetical protein [Enterobacter sp. Ap-1006]